MKRIHALLNYRGILICGISNLNLWKRNRFSYGKQEYLQLPNSNYTGSKQHNNFFRENQKEKKNVQQSIDRHGSLLWKEWFSHIITNMQENNNRIVWSFPSIFLGVFLNS
ncbi:MAG: hypothetical protein JO327_09980 [Nitrososphaeraceae archaeon]|nr:hypothetical protein [Nitrososphaeraceae archaeon]